MTALYTMEEAAAELRKPPRWLRDWLRRFPADHAGMMFYMQAGNSKLFSEDDIRRLRLALDPLGSAPPEGMPFKWTEGFIYVVEVDGFVKIGWTRNVRARLIQLQTSSPHKLNLLAVAIGTPATERELHKKYAALCVGGEWFRLDLGLRRNIKAIRNYPLTMAARREWRGRS